MDPCVEIGFPRLDFKEGVKEKTGKGIGHIVSFLVRTSKSDALAHGIAAEVRVHPP